MTIFKTMAGTCYAICTVTGYPCYFCVCELHVHCVKFHYFALNYPFCSDFRYESNGIFVLGVVFFSSDKFRLFNRHF